MNDYIWKWMRTRDTKDNFPKILSNTVCLCVNVWNGREDWHFSLTIKTVKRAVNYVYNKQHKSWKFTQLKMNAYLDTTRNTLREANSMNKACMKECVTVKALSSVDNSTLSRTHTVSPHLSIFYINLYEREREKLSFKIKQCKFITALCIKKGLKMMQCIKVNAV